MLLPRAARAESLERARSHHVRRFGVLVAGFAFAAEYLFGFQLVSYHNFLTSFSSLLRMPLGDFNYIDMQSVRALTRNGLLTAPPRAGPLRMAPTRAWRAGAARGRLDLLLVIRTRGVRAGARACKSERVLCGAGWYGLPCHHEHVYRYHHQIF